MNLENKFSLARLFFKKGLTLSDLVIFNELQKIFELSDKKSLWINYTRFLNFSKISSEEISRATYYKCLVKLAKAEFIQRSENAIIKGKQAKIFIKVLSTSEIWSMQRPNKNNVTAQQQQDINIIKKLGASDICIKNILVEIINIFGCYQNYYNIVKEIHNTFKLNFKNQHIYQLNAKYFAQAQKKYGKYLIPFLKTYTASNGETFCYYSINKEELAKIIASYKNEMQAKKKAKEQTKEVRKVSSLDVMSHMIKNYNGHTGQTCDFRKIRPLLERIPDNQKNSFLQLLKDIQSANLNNKKNYPNITEILTFFFNKEKYKGVILDDKQEPDGTDFTCKIKLPVKL